jgi:membrane protein implicated in regulation of membrane protease activity
MALVYLICLGVGLTFTLFSVIFGHVFGGHDAHVDGSGGHAEAGVDSSDMPGVSVFSPTVISSFVTAFGGFGFIFTRFQSTNTPVVSAVLAVVCAFVVAGAVFGFLRTVFDKTQSSSESKVAAVIGVTASVITPIPENGVGEIAYVVSGTRYTAPARVENGSAISSGKPVRITRVVGTQYYVEPA